MRVEVLKSKIHRAKITQAELHYVGSITIDEALMEAANLIEGEKVQVVNINNGERLETYAIKGEKNSGGRPGGDHFLCFPGVEGGEEIQARYHFSFPR
jgi:L-aspartate-alpha-decarboxylase